jgi:hypothetical protein
MYAINCRAAKQSQSELRGFELEQRVQVYAFAPTNTKGNDSKDAREEAAEEKAKRK